MIGTASVGLFVPKSITAVAVNIRMTSSLHKSLLHQHRITSVPLRIDAFVSSVKIFKAILRFVGVRIATPTLAILRDVVLELRRTLKDVTGTRLLISLLSVLMVVVSATIQTSRRGPFGRASCGFFAQRSIDGRLGDRKRLMFHFVMGGLDRLFTYPLKVVVATRRAVCRFCNLIYLT